MHGRWSTAVLLLSFLPSVLQAAPTDLGIGARAAGMADAFVAVADDSSALYYNPAGLPQLYGTELTAQYSQFLGGLSDGSKVNSNYLAVAQPLKSGEWGAVGISQYLFHGADYFDDRMLSVGYGYRLRRRLMGAGRWSIGGAVRQFHRSYQPDAYSQNALNDSGLGSGQSDPLFSKHGYAGDAYLIDLGALYQFGKSKNYSAGFSVQNINREDTSLGHDGDRAPLMSRAGGAAHRAWGLLAFEIRRAKRVNSGDDTELAAGIERVFALKPVGYFAMRGGYGQGSRGFRTVTVGMSFRVSEVRLDYSFDLPVGSFAEAEGNHRVAFSLCLGRTPSSDHYETMRRHYFERKADGADYRERLALLQEIYLHGHGRDLSWVPSELNSSEAGYLGDRQPWRR